MLKKIDWIDLDAIQHSTWKEAIQRSKNIDEFDAAFITLALEVNAPLWTDDKKLIEGLNQQGVD